MARIADFDTPDTEAGRRMYRDGILPSGEPLTAIVAGDVPVLGTQFSCQSCHGRSGMGASEGAYIVPPIAGQFLFAPSPQPARPAYTEASLAHLLREGVTAGGRDLSELMPLYDIGDEGVASITAYLAGLSSKSSPGVDDKVIRFATVITDDVTAQTRDAVLAVLDAFVRDKNKNTRLESERWDRGSTPSSRLHTVHRAWDLEVWELTGPSGTWAGQLEQRYASEPVFALLSGLSNQSWAPVSEFCERNEIPCLFPGTDFAEPDDGDFYTFYYSEGLVLEAGLIAEHLSNQPVEKVVQVYCGPGLPAAVAELRVLMESNGFSVDDYMLDCNDLPSMRFEEETGTTDRSALVVWLEQEELLGLSEQLSGRRVYFSSTLLTGELEAPILSVPDQAFVAHPFRLPDQIDPAFARFNVWARTRGIKLTAPRLQSEAFFACLALKDVVAHMGRFFIRDYVIDMLDHKQSLVAYLPYYPRPTLGPGQRFVNKGGYVLPILNGHPNTSGAGWIVP